MDWHVEGLQDAQVPVDSMGMVKFAWNSDIVEGARPFPGIVKANGAGAVSEPCHDAASEKALQVDDEIKLVAANHPETTPRLQPIDRVGPPFALKRNNSG